MIGMYFFFKKKKYFYVRFLTFLQSTTYGLPRNTYMILNGRLQQDEVL